MERSTGSISSGVNFGEDHSLQLTARRSSRPASRSIHPSRSSARMMSRPVGKPACPMLLLEIIGAAFYRIHSGMTTRTLSLSTDGRLLLVRRSSTVSQLRRNERAGWPVSGQAITVSSLTTHWCESAEGIRIRPNQPAAGNAGIASQLTIRRRRPGVPEPLGGMATDTQVDDAGIAYLAITNGRWRKVAMVFARVAEALGAEFPEGQPGHELFDRSIEVLMRDRRLVAQGDITLSRHSEVRLP